MILAVYFFSYSVCDLSGVFRRCDGSTHVDLDPVCVRAGRHCALKNFRDLPQGIVQLFFTAHQRSCEKVLFSLVSVCLFTGEGGSHVTITCDALAITVRGSPWS